MRVVISPDIIKDFITRARDVTIAEAAARLGLRRRGNRQGDHAQPCPACRGKDRFSFNDAKNVWNCRGAGIGGHDAIGMAAHVEGLDVNRRDGFLAACGLALGEDVPEGGEVESAEDRAARQARLAKAREKSEREAEAREQSAADYREAERRKARGLYETGQIGGGPVASYLARRGGALPEGSPLRFLPEATYWHGEDDAGRAVALHTGLAMVGPFVDVTLKVIGCHLTWIDLAAPPKFRPHLFGLTDKGREAGLARWQVGDALPSAEALEAGLYEQLATKKMRGSKKGGLIPIAGKSSARRWVGGEGVENGAAYGLWEGFRADSFYFAAGDLGNLAGPSASRFAHPTLKTTARGGGARAVMVQGPVPKPDQKPDEAMWIGAHVEELVLLADGDSEPVMTAAAMARAKARAAAPGRRSFILWPRRGGDFSKMAMEAEHG